MDEKKPLCLFLATGLPEAYCYEKAARRRRAPEPDRNPAQKRPDGR